MNTCADCDFILSAIVATRYAQEYQNRRFEQSSGWQDYDPAEAEHLGWNAAMLVAITPDEHHHETWHVSEYDDPAMMEVDPDAFVDVTPPWGCGPDDPLPDPKAVVEWHKC